MADIGNSHDDEVAALSAEERAELTAATERVRQWADGPDSDSVFQTLYDHELEALAMAAMGIGRWA
jgi:hypothetical protein